MFPVSVCGRGLASRHPRVTPEDVLHRRKAHFREAAWRLSGGEELEPSSQLTILVLVILSVDQSTCISGLVTLDSVFVLF